MIKLKYVTFLLCCTLSAYPSVYQCLYFYVLALSYSSPYHPIRSHSGCRMGNNGYDVTKHSTLFEKLTDGVQILRHNQLLETAANPRVLTRFIRARTVILTQFKIRRYVELHCIVFVASFANMDSCRLH